MFFQFRGGKGVATWLGTLFALAWPVMYLVPILGAALALTVLWRGIPQSRHPAPAEAQPDPETATGAETR